MLQGFDPIWDENARVLIVGSMPSVESLKKQQYYGHPRNAFWRIMADFAGKEFDLPYEERKAMLRDMHIALWDVVQFCDRQGSLDSAIRNEVPNDFAWLFSKTRITHVCANGKTAEPLFQKYVTLPSGVTFCGALASTSPAYTLSFEKKKVNWQVILPYLERE
ncbi:MAG: DNA-deoxyinosine glycosylase [Clostridia bacterium]|nr:DNA-deoxyinosine glycosylase [Clostridia bacterium]